MDSTPGRINSGHSDGSGRQAGGGPLASRGSSSYDKEMEGLTASLFVEPVIAGGRTESKNSSRQNSPDERPRMYEKTSRYRDSMERNEQQRIAHS